MKNPFLIGEKVYLRPLDRADAPTLQPWINDPDVRRTLLLNRPLNLQAEESWLDSTTENSNAIVLGIAVKADDKLIGVTGLEDVDIVSRHAVFGIVVGLKEEWGRGYGSEATRLMIGHAFQTMNLNRVWLHVYEFNTSAIHVYEKVGFKREGTLRQHCFREGRYWNTLTMAILREEWRS